ncbi:MAG: threonylcarbamoyl-AMP synthase [Planctomycetia bacterium]|nr:threonylcarbamoyl-AMP synthase [Planctomycetia bacterium]
MHTELLTVDPQRPEPERIARAAAIIRRGGLVAFPTETVYGLGANALDSAAVQKIFAAKGRPSNNPLIVHVTTLAAAKSLASAWPEVADRLAARFWPGPLTFVLPKSDVVPALVTAGGPTVALRMPAHPVARALLDAAATPLAAPSANRSTQVSAVRAEHVVRALSDRIEMVLDGGAAWDGLESTVVDLTSNVVRILRPGPIDSILLGEVLGYEPSQVEVRAEERDGALSSPGQLRKHYSPSATVELTLDDGRASALRSATAGLRVGWLPMPREDAPPKEAANVVYCPMPRDPAAYGRLLYDVFHRLEAAEVDVIVVESPPMTSAWAAVLDRLTRAAAT